jgi:hypothetical protein
MKMYQELPSGTLALLARKISGTITGQDYVNWAVEALTENFISPNLAILAGLDLEINFSLWEAEKYFENVVTESGWSILDHVTILRSHLISLLTSIQNGTIDPETGVDRIHREVISPLGHPSDLQGWCLLWEGIYPVVYGVIPKDEYPSKIIEYAKEWLAKNIDDET